MKVLLIATNQTDRFMDRMVVRPVPIGLAYLAAYVNEERHDLQVLDLMFSDDAGVDVENSVKSFQPDVVGLSMRNLDNQSFLNPVWNLPRVRDIVGRVRQSSDATIVCGGPAFSILPAECLAYVGADLGIAGDAAEVFTTLMERIESGIDYKDIPGLVYREGGQVIVTEGRFSSDFQRPPRLDMLDMARYNGSGFGVGVITKLAQAYYSTSGQRGQFSGQDWRIRPPEDVVSEIRKIGEDFGINKIFFIDSGFNVPLSHAKQLCQAIVDSGLKIRWNSYLRGGECDGELTQLMKDSGCSLALLAEAGGSSSGSGLAEQLDRIGAVAGLCRSVGLPFTVNLNFGEPGESRATVDQKLAFLKQVEPAFAVLRVGNRILPKTTLASRAIDESIIESEADLLEPVFYIDSRVREWLPDYLRDAATAFPRWNLM